MQSIIQLIAKLKSSSSTLLLLLCLSLIWWQAVRWYDDYLLQVESKQVEQQLNQYAEHLSVIVHKRLRLLEELTYYIEAENLAQPGFSGLRMRKVNAFASGLLFSSKDIQNFSIAPAGIVQYESGKQGNHKLLDLDLLNDERYSIRQSAKLAISSRQLVLSDPIELSKGTLSLIAHKAIFVDQQFWGLVSLVLDLPALIDVAGLNDPTNPLAIEVQDTQGLVVHTNTQMQQLSHAKSINLMNQHWLLSADMCPSFSEIVKQSMIFKLIFGAFSLLLFGLFSLQSWHLLTSAGNNINRYNDHIPDLAVQKPSWLLPCLVSIAILFSLIVSWILISMHQGEHHQLNKSLIILMSLLAFGICLYFWRQYNLRSQLWSKSESVREDFQNFRDIVQFSPTAIIICNPNDSTIIFANQRTGSLLRCDPDDLINRHSGDFYSNPEDRLKCIENLHKQGQFDNFELMIKRRDGSCFWGSLSAKLVTLEQDQAIIVSIADLSERKNYEQKIFQQANYDTLTKLPNRSLALDRLKIAISRAQRAKNMVALLIIDLDNFKAVNESFSHIYGDLVLQDFADKLQSCIRLEDTVARFGSDEFLIIIPDIKNDSDVRVIAQKILQTCCQPIVIEGNKIDISTSIGISIYPHDGYNQLSMLKNADTAMNRCKAQNRNNFCFYSRKRTEPQQV